MVRSIIRINEEKCNGCGACAIGCPEGALQIIDGKARLVSEITCDGLGACIGTCPEDAILVETREAEAYDETKVLDNIVPMGPNTLKAHLQHLDSHNQTEYLASALAYLAKLNVPVPEYKEKIMHTGCPGSQARTIERPTAAAAPQEGLVSQLTQWPVQLHLVGPSAPYFQKADLLLAADCTAFALPDFNQKWLAGKKLAIACPKLDDGQDSYIEKLVALIDDALVNTITVLIMEVPCCGGLSRIAAEAASRAKRKVPIKIVVVGIDGEIRSENWA